MKTLINLVRYLIFREWHGYCYFRYWVKRFVGGYMFKRIKNNKGLSLVETILTVIIVTVALLSGLSTFQTGVSASVKLERSSIASHLANEKIETIMADKEFLGYSYASDDSNYPTEELLEGYTRDVYITEVDSTDLSTPQPGSGINKVDVVVSWANAEEDQVVITTLIADVN